ncbi:hypothetical protein RND81_11G188500 [Saponaria officinalis]|uniref:Uncharacterized protein n=1 Tax=Saponaria officinalis TaxID=3572 RepID=A0AAW1HQJ8_SAPOF
MATILSPILCQYAPVSSTTTCRRQPPITRLRRRFTLSPTQQSRGLRKPATPTPACTGGSGGGSISGIDVDGDGGVAEKSMADLFNEVAVMIESSKRDGGGPRWFTPTECGEPRSERVPLKRTCKYVISPPF